LCCKSTALVQGTLRQLALEVGGAGSLRLTLVVGLEVTKAVGTVEVAAERDAPEGMRPVVLLTIYFYFIRSYTRKKSFVKDFFSEFRTHQEN